MHTELKGLLFRPDPRFADQAVGGRRLGRNGTELGAHFLAIEFTLVIQAHEALPGSPRSLRVEPDVVGNLQVFELPGAQAFLHVRKPLNPSRKARCGAHQVAEQVAHSLSASFGTPR